MINRLNYTGNRYYRPQRSWAKVMFLQLSVILLTGGVGVWYFRRGGCLIFSGGRGVSDFFGGWYPSPPPPGILSMRGQYASYWNAFLFFKLFLVDLFDSGVFLIQMGKISSMLDSGLEPHQCLYLCKYVWIAKRLATRLAIKSLAGVAPGSESEEFMVHRWWCMKVRDPSRFWNRGQMSQVVQNRAISDPTEKSDIFQFVFFLKEKEHLNWLIDSLGHGSRCGQWQMWWTPFCRQ